MSWLLHPADSRTSILARKDCQKERKLDSSLDPPHPPVVYLNPPGFLYTLLRGCRVKACVQSLQPGVLEAGHILALGENENFSTIQEMEPLIAKGGL